MRTLSIARMTFHEARMRKLLWALAVLGLLFLAVYATGFYFMYRDLSRFVGPTSNRVLEPVNFLMLAGLYVVNFIVVLMAVATSVDTIAGEIASGTIQTIVIEAAAPLGSTAGEVVGAGAHRQRFHGPTSACSARHRARDRRLHAAQRVARHRADRA